MTAMKDENTPASLPVRFLKHLRTIEAHRSEVMKNCFKCGLYKQGLTHDLSKYNPREFVPSVKHFQGYRSPYMKEKELYGYSLGWLHHKGRNPHHWEYWYDMINGVWQPVKVPYRYVAEMICDRVAACKIYQKDKYTQASALEYWNTRKDCTYMHEDTRKEIEKLLTMIKDEGEEKTFALIKRNIQNDYTY